MVLEKTPDNAMDSQQNPVMQRKYVAVHVSRRIPTGRVQEDNLLFCCPLLVEYSHPTNVRQAFLSWPSGKELNPTWETQKGTRLWGWFGTLRKLHSPFNYFFNRDQSTLPPFRFYTFKKIILIYCFYMLTFLLYTI